MLKPSLIDRRKKHARRREALALGLGLASAAALVWAAFASYGDPDLAGQAALDRIAREVAGSLRESWEQRRLGRLSDWKSEYDGIEVRWTLPTDPIENSTAPEPADASAQLAFDALLSEARRLNHVESDLAGALRAVERSLTGAPDARRRAEGRLFAIQLALRLEDASTARRHWQAARDELDGQLARDGTSYLLLTTLAVAPFLSDDERLRARDRLAELWSENALRLPAVEAPDETNLHASWHAPSPLRDAWRRRCQALGNTPDPRFEETRIVDRGHWIAQFFPQWTPGPAQPSRTLAPLRVHMRGDWVLISRPAGSDRSGGSGGSGVYVGVLQHRLPWLATTLLTLNNALPRGIGPGFLVEVDGETRVPGNDPRPEVPSEVVHATTALSGTNTSFALRHTDPQSVIAQYADRQGLLRAALLGLSALTAATGFAIHRALVRQRKLAELKTTFVANVSHELRTPISSIMLMAENLKEQRVETPEARERYHQLIQREAQRLRRLVDDVLDFSRVERGQSLHLRRTSIDVAQFAERLRKAAEERVAQDGGELTFEQNGIPSSLWADEEALRRAVLNLVDNAKKHSGEKDVEICLGGYDRGGLVVSVRDRGKGVPESQLESIFEPFMHPEAQGSSQRGTGLGLAIVKGIAVAHGGDVRARLRQPAPGLAFVLRIPRGRAAEDGA